MYDVALPSGTLHRHTPTTGVPHANRRQGLGPGCAGCVSTGTNYIMACNKETETRPGLHETMRLPRQSASVLQQLSSRAFGVGHMHVVRTYACGAYMSIARLRRRPVAARPRDCEIAALFAVMSERKRKSAMPWGGAASSCRGGAATCHATCVKLPAAGAAVRRSRAFITVSIHESFLSSRRAFIG